MSLDNRLRLAVGERRVSTYPLQEVLPCVNRILLQTYALVGFKPPCEHDLGLLIAKVATDLQESYPSLTLQEVELYFELGAKGEYDDFMGLNLRTITRWLKTYQTSELRYRAVVERERQAQAALPTVSETYKEEHEYTYLQRVFEQYRAGYKPAGNMIVSEDVRQVLVKQQAMAILLKEFFDEVIEEEGELLMIA